MSGQSAPERVAAVSGQKALILQHMGDQLQLPAEPECPPSGSDTTDRILLAACSLPKGRQMLAGLLNRYPPGSPLACRIVWAVARNLSHIVAPPPPPKRSLGDATTLASTPEDASAAKLVNAAAGAASAFDAAQICGAPASSQSRHSRLFPSKIRPSPSHTSPSPSAPSQEFQCRTLSHAHSPLLSLAGVLAAVIAGAGAPGRSFPPANPTTTSGKAVASFLVVSHFPARLKLGKWE